MPVTTLGHWAGEHDACRVNCLPDALAIHSPSDLLDENWGEALRSKLLVNTQEVDLCHLARLVIHLHHRWNAGDETYELTSSLHSHTEMPLSQVLWWLQRPPKKLNRIVKAEHAVIVFDVIFTKQCVDLLDLSGIIHVAGAPFEGSRQSIRFSSDVVNRLHLINWAIVVGAVLGTDGRHWLRVPERVRPLHVAPGILADSGAPEKRKQLLLAGQSFTVLGVLCFLLALLLLILLILLTSFCALCLFLLLLFLLGCSCCSSSLLSVFLLLFLFFFGQLCGLLVCFSHIGPSGRSDGLKPKL
mmetsp:Transcript_39085/g.70547  ORF Transcript_39085/g.70547 Transcript_39085/m.70547 type:complete len:300 (+) Transcript_39085:641-1540(+)